MSFSSEVKEEMAVRPDSARHCRIASLAAMLHFSGYIGADGAGIQTENEYAAAESGGTTLVNTLQSSITQTATEIRTEVSTGRQ